jgi:hypothetical protein
MHKTKPAVVAVALVQLVLMVVLDVEEMVEQELI